MRELTPSRRPSAMEHAYNELKTQIIDGTLLPNQSIVEQSVSKELEVSRTPLREAIQRLELEALLTRKSNGRLKVAPLSIKEVEEVFQVRSKLETIAVEDAMNNMTDEDMEQLTHLSFMINQMHQQKIMKEVIRYGEKFHHYIYELSGNKTVIKLLSQLKDHIARYRQLTPMNESGESCESINEHQLILRYMIDGDVERASSTMEKHITRSMYSVMERISSDKQIQ